MAKGLRRLSRAEMAAMTPEERKAQIKKLEAKFDNIQISGQAADAINDREFERKEKATQAYADKLNRKRRQIKRSRGNN